MNKKMILSLVIAFSIVNIEAQRLQRRQRTPQQLSEFAKIQQDFKQLQLKLGISTSNEVINSVCRIPGKQGDWKQLNSVRSELNTLLSKNVLTDPDIKVIERKIDELADLNPARWPRPWDYTVILKLRK